MGLLQWSTATKTDGLGWAIIHTARMCHYRKGKKCTVPFPKGELCTLENCPMRPQDFADMFPEEYQELQAKLTTAESERDGYKSQCEALAKELKGTTMALKYLMEALDIDPEETRIDIKGVSGVVASVTFAELCSRAEAALAATEVKS